MLEYDIFVWEFADFGADLSDWIAQGANCDPQFTSICLGPEAPTGRIVVSADKAGNATLETPLDAPKISFEPGATIEPEFVIKSAQASKRNRRTSNGW